MAARDSDQVPHHQPGHPNNERRTGNHERPAVDLPSSTLELLAKQEEGGRHHRRPRQPGNCYPATKGLQAPLDLLSVPRNRVSLGRNRLAGGRVLAPRKPRRTQLVSHLLAVPLAAHSEARRQTANTATRMGASCHDTTGRLRPSEPTAPPRPETLVARSASTFAARTCASSAACECGSHGTLQTWRSDGSSDVGMSRGVTSSTRGVLRPTSSRLATTAGRPAKSRSTTLARLCDTALTAPRTSTAG